ncbi:hypothetical protein SBF1_4820006 [Candidatus Desulfosporosinus infrequens]|uniref:Uncharacterized protein n=1 Tax=Candidatus Desulfosporosinus infrequens TaxID=2043169 RepID=A0A2U3LF69_9FIRM|nr:hypothetical protein SBF1_4820006 [Candidatus Desulfosporosinus infrequens]
MSCISLSIDAVFLCIILKLQVKYSLLLLNIYWNLVNTTSGGNTK